MGDTVYMRHVRECNYCKGGFKAFCKARGWDYKNFFKKGITIKELKELAGDESNGLLDKVIDAAKKDNK